MITLKDIQELARRYGSAMADLELARASTGKDAAGHKQDCTTQVRIQKDMLDAAIKAFKAAGGKIPAGTYAPVSTAVVHMIEGIDT